MDFAIIGGLLYLSNVMNTYFPPKKKIKRKKHTNKNSMKALFGR